MKLMHTINSQYVNSAVCQRAPGLLLKTIHMYSCGVFLATSALLSLCLWPPLPSLRGTSRLIDNFICSWREEGDEYMTYPLCVGIEWRGGRFPFFLFLSLPGCTSGPLYTHLVFNSDKWAHFFWKALGRSLGKRGVRTFFFFCHKRTLACSQTCPFLVISAIFLCANGINCAWHSRVDLSIFWAWWLVFVPDLSDENCTSSVAIVAGKKTWDVVACCL